MRRMLAIFFILITLPATGCTRVEPWVKPYEREQLADPVMAWDRDPVSCAYVRHVYEAREGARGAARGAGGGCGCN
jgi:hypothetical protein